jgi:hypothetical protein
LADADGNGERDLIDYALGNNLGLPPLLPAFKLQPENLDGLDSLLLIYPVSLGAEGARIEVLFSTYFGAWQEGGPHLEAVSVEHLGDGRALLTWRVKPPLRDEREVFMRLRAVGE